MAQLPTSDCQYTLEAYRTVMVVGVVANNMKGARDNHEEDENETRAMWHRCLGISHNCGYVKGMSFVASIIWFEKYKTRLVVVVVFAGAQAEFIQRYKLCSH